MTDWPTKNFIHITRAFDGCKGEIEDKLAFLDKDGDYITIGGGFLSERAGDRIDEWEEVTPVPTAQLKALDDAWLGNGGENTAWLRAVEDAMTPILAALPADKPSQLGVVTEAAKQHDRGVRLSDDGYVARLLRIMPGNTSHPGYTDLLHAARCSAEHLRWAGFPDPWEEIFIEAADVSLPVSEDSQFSLLVKSIGKFLVTRDPDSATQIGAVALAWAAKITEGGRA